ncbi:MAG: undecaprenyldiphospho-muramoylpentapeptide beta-N-acetylglucosaminyltransferase [Erysipelotrichia bacterium]|nr:undecaprenyldiphospho-muramoylpentapeptide beta-N-acetylglucosaminyltransferase [Erysipelotrichia bacterium]NCC54122.1 undecaprenyldiphospho-muramoylpentapeptide beta-N-acetylglucosaminyltransferase [Erysipelotrichia bacterium]
MKMVIATGGTGGHIYPALALAEKAKQRYTNLDILFIGNDDRMEKDVIPANGYAFKGLHTSGLTGSLLNKCKALVQMVLAQKQAKKILTAFQPDIVIGFGGYVSAPVLLAAHKLKFKTMIHEQNSMVGKSNQVLANKVDGIVICYEKCFAQMPKEKTRLLGNPRSTLAKETKFNARYFHSLQVDESKPIVLVVMGSLGSSSVNEMMVEALKGIEDVTFIYVTGKKDYANMKNKFKQPNVYVVDYVDQLAILKRIDLMVCRAGATTAAEITALGVPSILIPSPYVAHNHQFYNASVLVDKKCAFMIEEKDLNKDILYDKINMVIHNQKLMNDMKNNALAISYPNASEDILSFVDEIVG